MDDPMRDWMMYDLLRKLRTVYENSRTVDPTRHPSMTDAFGKYVTAHVFAGNRGINITLYPFSMLFPQHCGVPEGIITMFNRSVHDTHLKREDSYAIINRLLESAKRGRPSIYGNGNMLRVAELLYCLARIGHGPDGEECAIIKTGTVWVHGTPDTYTPEEYNRRCTIRRTADSITLSKNESNSCYDVLRSMGFIDSILEAEPTDDYYLYTQVRRVTSARMVDTQNDAANAADVTNAATAQ